MCLQRTRTSRRRRRASTTRRSLHRPRALVSSVPVTPSHPSTYDTLHGKSETPLSKGKIFGLSTEAVLACRGLPRQTHISFETENNYPVDYWVQALRLKVKDCSNDVAHDLIEAMKADGRLTASTRS